MGFVSVIAAFLVFVSAQSRGDSNFEHECFKEGKTFSSPACQLGQVTRQVQGVSQVLSAPDVIGKLENDLFWDFTKDQMDQTKCELDMVQAMSLLPDRGACLDPRTQQTEIDRRNRMSPIQRGFENIGKSPRTSQTAYKFQEQALKDVWKKLPEIVQRKKDCENSQKAYQHSSYAVNGEIVDNDSSGHHREMLATCGKLENSYEGLWSANTPEIRQFIDVWADRYDKDPKYKNDPSGAAFLSDALPSNPAGFLKKGGDLTVHEWGITFEKIVLEKMRCRAGDRYQTLRPHFNNAQTELLGGTFVPETIQSYQDVKNIEGRSAADKDRIFFKNFLMRDGGIAANAYMQRTPKYSPMASEMQCHLRFMYKDQKESEEFVRNVVVGVVSTGVAIVATGGGAAVAGAALVIDGAIAADAYRRAKEICGSNYFAPDTLQMRPMCEVFQKAKGDPLQADNIRSEMESRSCNAAQLDFAISAAGAAASGIATGAKVARAGAAAADAASGTARAVAVEARAGQTVESGMAASRVQRAQEVSRRSIREIASSAKDDVRGIRRVTIDELPDVDTPVHGAVYAVQTEDGKFVKVQMWGHKSDGSVIVAPDENDAKLFTVEPTDLWKLPETGDFPRKIPIGSRPLQGPVEVRTYEQTLARVKQDFPGKDVKVRPRLGKTGQYDVLIDNKLAGRLEVQIRDSGNTMHLQVMNVGEEFKGSGVSNVLLQEVLARHPGVKQLTASLDGTNLRTFSYYFRKGLSPEECVMQTPAYRMQAAAGFSKIEKIEVGSKVKIVMTRP
jgi:hypothetical protein